MLTVCLKPLYHREQECIGIYFHANTELNLIIRKLRGIKWSQGNKCWYLPLSKESYNHVFFALMGKATIEKSALHEYLAKKKMKDQPAEKRIAVTKAVIPVTKKEVKQNTFIVSKGATVYKDGKIQSINAHVIPVMEQQLKLKAYSRSTIKTYLGEITQLLTILGTIPADELRPEHLKRYLVYCYEKLKLTENTLHSRINAMKFYYEQVLKREKFFWEIPRPKKQIQLPKFFNQDEIAAIIKAVDNLKHKTMLMLAYAAGLRVSEVVSIKVSEIDSKRMCIIIKQAKGKKDRIVALSPVLLVMLREYRKSADIKKEGYLFPGQDENEAYSTGSLQLVIQEAKKKAGVIKPGSIHALRHSFATHLLDKGTDVTMIMKLLGHNDIKTTLRYLHVTNRDMLQIVSPLDDLKL